MQRFTDSVRQSIENKNWYAALSLALILPDICGRLENPSAQSKERYIAWFEKWLGSAYKTYSRGEERIFLSGADCYALRCAVIHEGSDNISEQKARQALDRFHFVEPLQGIIIHNNQMDSMLQLQVDIFCHDICKAVDNWMTEKASDHDVTANSAGLIHIHDMSKGIPGTVSFS